MSIKNKISTIEGNKLRYEKEQGYTNGILIAIETVQIIKEEE
ncbi:hypothetical protein LCGC14_3123140 [marine sediment metagenome]|uniref:Uncharacterized protein n=1 Tax=marine sediment metagenome TaxID=412755 RepID=A0A0F8W1X9_9ZZZZ